MAAERDITIKQGKTFSLEMLWRRGPIIRKAITAIAKHLPFAG